MCIWLCQLSRCVQLCIWPYTRVSHVFQLYPAVWQMCLAVRQTCIWPAVPDVSMYTGLDYPLYCRVYCTLDCKLNCTIYWTLDCLPDDVHGPGLHIGLSGRLYTVLYHILDTGLYLMVYNRLYAGPHSVHWTEPYTVHRTRLHSTLDVQYTVYSGCPLACTQLKEVPSWCFLVHHRYISSEPIYAEGQALMIWDLVPPDFSLSSR